MGGLVMCSKFAQSKTIFIGKLKKKTGHAVHVQ